MIRIDAVIASEKVSMVVDALKKVGVGGITVFDAKGWGKGRRSRITSSRGTGSYIAEYNARNYLFTVVEDELVDKVISAIADAAGTGSVGDGKIFVTKIDDAVDIGSKQKGIHAI